MNTDGILVVGGILLIILFEGEPDLMDAIIHWFMK